jgi:hypothetical protein
VIEQLDWQTFVSRFYPGSARHDFRVLKALRVWEEEGGAA